MSFIQKLFGGNKQPSVAAAEIIHDFSTPEGALLCLADAYKEKNMDKVLLCRDFDEEAKMMLQRMMNDGGSFGQHRALQDQTSKALRLSFIKQLNESGFPEVRSGMRSFPKKEMINEEHAIVTEVCTYDDKTTSSRQMHVVKTRNGWKVLNSDEH